MAPSSITRSYKPLNLDLTSLLLPSSRRAFSDQPLLFNSGFAKVERVMKALHVRRLALWPRFHQAIQAALSCHPPELVEWEQEPSSAMMLIQV